MSASYHKGKRLNVARLAATQRQDERVAVHGKVNADVLVRHPCHAKTNRIRGQ